MADYVPAWIEIGGPIPRQIIPELIDCIEGDCLSDDYGAKPIEPKSAEDLLELAIDENGDPGTLKLYHEEAHNGEFDELEEFLEEHSIGFDRHGDGGGDFSPEIKRYRAGWLAPTITFLDGAGQELIPSFDVGEGLKLLRAGKTAEAIGHFAALTNEGVPALQPLEFVG